MKNIYIYIIIVITIVVVCFFLFRNGFSKKKINSIKELDYSIYSGSIMNGNIYYKLKCDNKCILESKLFGFGEDEFISIEVDSKSIDEIIDVLNEVNVYAWNGFNKSNKNVLDGSSYSFNLITDKDTITAHGYMAYPKNFSITLKKICAVFDKLNQKTYTRLFDLDMYKDFNINNVSKVIIDENGEVKESSEKEEINRIYNRFKNQYLTKENTNEIDNDYIYKYSFIMNNGDKYEIVEQYDYLVVDGKRYYNTYIDSE